MKDESKFWDRIAQKYYRSPIKDLDAYQEKLNITRTFFKPDSKILEFGCGTGGTALAHAPYVEHVHAIDFSENMLCIARSQAEQQQVSNVTFEQNSIESFSAPPASYDAILGLSVLHLVEDRNAVLEKVFAMLKPNGVFVSSTACMGDNIKFFKYIVPIGRALGFFPLVKVFEQKQLVSELKSSAFTVTQQWRPKKSMAAFIVARKEQQQEDLISSSLHVDQDTTQSSSTKVLHAAPAT